MTTYLVVWTIEVDADTPFEAAREARVIQQDPNAIAHSYYVLGNGNASCVDLDDGAQHPANAAGIAADIVRAAS